MLKRCADAALLPSQSIFGKEHLVYIPESRCTGRSKQLLRGALLVSTIHGKSEKVGRMKKVQKRGVLPSPPPASTPHLPSQGLVPLHLEHPKSGERQQTKVSTGIQFLCFSTEARTQRQTFPLSCFFLGISMQMSLGVFCQHLRASETLQLNFTVQKGGPDGQFSTRHPSQ